MIFFSLNIVGRYLFYLISIFTFHVKTKQTNEENQHIIFIDFVFFFFIKLVPRELTLFFLR